MKAPGNLATPAGRLLLVEDDSALRLMMCWELELLGYRVVQATSCQEAMAMLETGPEFEFALLDYHLPDGVVTHLLSPLKRCLPQVRIAVCSGMASPQVASQVRALGAFGFYGKPVDLRLIHIDFQRSIAVSLASPEH